ncbi:zinc-binding alcohol dehydrogenase family protein [Paenibacillus taihuensis]|uniref:Zinc-type alcohol dehydrogenase-like protein n=1 Tax=Paenibacillus taihuensis TaxID=1156355 RepID=A0A3D9SQA2_9BACL|nr:zinc-binding alcohol dehydrogenase family protein [Paenibacillus taihuensis]REE92861.1 zinc-binding alcohol dehydrogenase family protein [Paenibacillus taihuensis]
MTPFMRAVGLTHYLPITREDSLMDIEVEKPGAPAGRDILVKVEAISVNPIDTKQRAPKDKVESTPRILGWDASGTVEAVGPACELLQPGDRVYYSGSVTRQGCNSEYQLVDERIAARMPASLNYAEAAALPLTSVTAWEALHDRLHIAIDKAANAGKTILVVGAAGGVGSIAMQLAKLAGLTVIGSASRASSKSWAIDHGADHIINHHKPWMPQLEAIGLRFVDYILCTNATTAHFLSMAEAIAPQGAICSIVDTTEPVPLHLLKSKSVTFVWEFMFTRSMFETADMIEQHRILSEVSQLVDEGALWSTLNERLSPINAANLRAAHAKLESGTMIGKLVIEDWQ